jgi:hypothetical protein
MNQSFSFYDVFAMPDWNWFGLCLTVRLNILEKWAGYSKPWSYAIMATSSFVEAKR